jgi:transposase-like protein
VGQSAKPTRQNRTITVDFQEPSTYVQLMNDGKAFVEFVFAFLLSLGFQLAHKATCTGGGCLTRHSHYARIRLGGLTIWRIQCTSCKAVFTVLPHFVLRYRRMSPDVARQALLATHGGLSLAWCATIFHISTMSLYRVICAFGQQRLLTVLTRCGLPLPTYILADEKHSRCLTERVYLPTIVRGRVLWHLGYSASKSAAAFTESYGVFQRAALEHEPSYQVRGALTDGFDSTVSSMRALFPGARLGFCLRHALNKLPDKLIGVSAAVRHGLRSKFHALLHRCRQRKSLRVVALGQRLRHFADRIATTVGEAHGERVRHWFQNKKAGWYTVLADPQMPAMSTVLDQAHNAIDRKLFAMKGFHHPGGSQAAFLTGLAHLYNLIPYQRRAKNAGLCGVQVEGGRVPTADWMLNLQILTSGGYRYAPDPPNH